jgi:uncharacterized protein
VENWTFFSSIVISLVIEAAPFLLLGSLISAVLAQTSAGDFLARRFPKSRTAGVGAGLLSGMVLPTCECGVVPVARRFLDRGVPPHAALTYMQAAPVINPVVLISTYVAFQGNLWMVGGRVAIVALVAVCIGMAFSGSRASDLIRNARERKKPLLTAYDPKQSACGHDALCGCGGGEAVNATYSAPLRVARGAALEFLEMGKFLIIGACAAAAFKTFLPSSILAFFEAHLILSLLAMMGLAVLLSVCSEADAFVAASFTTMPAASQLAFITLGPMVDLKLMAMFFHAFHWRVAMVLIAVPTLLVFLLTLLIGVLFPGVGR